MLKKILSLAVAAAMTAAVLSGCTAEDVAMYKALINEPEYSVTKESVDYDVSLAEPMSGGAIEESGGALVNYVLNLCGGLLSLTDVEATIIKSGDVKEIKTVTKLPDLSLTTTGWAKTGEDGASEVVYVIPSFLRPLLPEAVSKKQYLSINSAGMLYAPLSYMYGAQSMAAGADSDLGVIGGADGPTAVFVSGAKAAPQAQFPMNLLIRALKDPAVIDRLGPALDISLGTTAQKSGGNTVYTYKLDSSGINSLIRGVMSSLAKDEVTAALGIISGIPASVFKSDLADAQEGVDMVCQIITASGMFDQGLSASVTVNSDGYVTGENVSFEMMIDVNKIYNAILDSIATTGGDAGYYTGMENGDALRGRFKIGIKSASEVTDLNRPVTVSFPELTEENTIDYAKEFSDYQSYVISKAEWERGWNDYGEVNSYAWQRQPGEPLTIRNNDTGAEVVTVPITTNEIYPDEDDGFMSMYMPISDVAAVIPGISYNWNDALMGVEVRYTKPDGSTDYELYPTEAGSELYLNAVYGEDGNEHNEDTVYSAYDFVDTYGLYYNGHFYVEYDAYNKSLGYKSRFEDGKYCYTSETDAAFKSDVDLSANTFYAFSKIFG